MSDRERWAYEELRAGDPIQEGDQWLNPDGRWQAVVVSAGSTAEVWCSRVRRPHNITMMLAAFANQAEVLAEVRADEKRLFDDLELLRSEYAKLQRERDEACRERDLARAEVARLSTELWARKPLEDRVAALTDEVTQLRVERQEWIDWYDAKGVNALQVSEQLTAAKDALKTAQRARDELQLQVDELRDLVHELHGSMDEIADAGTAEDVKEMLCTWATELDYSSDCFDAVGKSQLDIVQKTLITAIARIEIEFGKEADSADA